MIYTCHNINPPGFVNGKVCVIDIVSEGYMGARAYLPNYLSLSSSLSLSLPVSLFPCVYLSWSLRYTSFVVLKEISCSIQDLNQHCQIMITLHKTTPLLIPSSITHVTIKAVPFSSIILTYFHFFFNPLRVGC